MDWKALTKLLRPPDTTMEILADDDEDDSVLKLKKSLREYFSQPLEDEQTYKEATKEESLVAELFAGIATVKAAYAQLQLAQRPYNPDAIHLADKALVAEMKSLSILKRCYLKNQTLISHKNPQESMFREQQNLIKIYEITIDKFDSELVDKDAEINTLRSQLQETETANRSLQSNLHPCRTLYSLHDLHLSGLNPNHFLVALRSVVKSIKSFTKLMMKKMDSSGWDLASAAKSMYPSLPCSSRSHVFFFRSFVCLKIFSEFDRRDFGLSFLHHRSSWDCQEFFHEFLDSKCLSTKQFLDHWGEFVKAKYKALVHPKMEMAFFGKSGGRAGFRDSDFGIGFAEMLRRLWVLHSLFFSFGPELNGSIFRARSGCRFSEVYMESVSDEGPSLRRVPTVGFTVVPGFRMGSTVIQCKVYLSS